MSSVVTASGLRRWALVAAVVAVLVAIPVTINVWPARAAEVDPAVLRDRMAASGTQPFQGYAQSSGLLGLPDLPNLSDVSALLSGTTEMRTWYASPTGWRVDVLGEGTERDLYQTPDGQVTWDFGDNQLTRVTGAQPVRLPRAADVTPPELVRRLLSAAAGDRAEALPAKRVAGIAAAGLRLIPSSPDTTVAHVDIWADPERGLPLQAEVTAKGGVRPVFRTRFLEIDFSVPPAGVLTPPAPRAGIGYTETEAPDILSVINRRGPAPLPASVAGLPRRDALAGVSAAGVYGTGLSSVVVAGLPGRLGGRTFRQIANYGQRLTDDAALISTGLLTVLVVRGPDRTFLAAGLVAPQLMQRAATDLAGVS